MGGFQNKARRCHAKVYVSFAALISTRQRERNKMKKYFIVLAAMPFLRNFRPGESCAYADYPKEFELKERQSGWECGFECANFTVLAAMRTTISKEIYEQLCAPARL